MPRPKKCRRVEFLPGVTYFKPAGMPLRDLEEVRMSIEEIEVIRLKDLAGLEQEQGAEKMNVSRPTFQRILTSARQKITDALLSGKAIRIDGGNFEMTWRRFRCQRGHEWETAIPVSTPPELCPECKETDIETVPNVRIGSNLHRRGNAGERYRTLNIR